MRFHFFSRTDANSRDDFRLSYIIQNLNTLKTVSVIYFLLCLTIRIIFEVVDPEIKKIRHLDEYDLPNLISIIVLPVFYLISAWLRQLIKADKKYAAAAQFVVFVFTLFLMINTMRATFYSMHNPRNTLVMYMMGLIIAGLFFTFEFYGTLALALLTGICFSATLIYYQHDTTELYMNNLASLILLTVFYAISRFSFSYRADNFFKLKAIEEKNIEIEDASKVKNEILGIVAHDLKNPLAAIRTLATMMESDKHMDAENLDNLQMIRSSCDKATAIINDLLESAHNDTGNEFKLMRSELNKFLLLIVDEWQKNKKDKVNILFYGLKQPVYALINKEKLQRAMDNLISNAIKFSGFSDHIEISLKEKNGEAFIIVQDFGVGIPEDFMPYIFDRFSRASRRGIRGEESIGLGLSIVQDIVKKHVGDIRVKSAEGAGTTFTIRLNSIN